ncbi:MAG: hypothetical protein ACXWTT_00895 [Methylobacter sp.]
MKKTFLTSIAVLAATLAVNASAALPESVSAKLPQTTFDQQNLQAQNPFVLERPNEHGLFVAAHSSHSSHASHASHVSSR